MLEEFINENFLTPLCRYYTLPGTIIYGLILILAVLGTYKLLRKLNIKIDKKFFIGVLPFIIYGGWTRALRDHMLGIYQNNLFCSPPIYFFIFVVALASLLIGVFIERKTKKFSYEKLMLIVGLVLLIYNLSLTTIKNFFAFSFVFLLSCFWFLIFTLISNLKPKLLSRINAGILASHLLDASASFTAIEFFGYYEQHVVPTFLINIFGPLVMFPLKLIVVWLVLYLIDNSKEDLFFKRFLKIIILILGLALGIRNLLTISML